MTTFIVNVAGDVSGTNAGTGSGTSGDLRYCLYQASLNGVIDSITFDSTAFTAQNTITLSATLATVPGGYVNPYGQTSFIIGADDVTIDGSLGAGRMGITIDGAGATRLFAIQGGGSLSLNNITLAGGNAVGGMGGNGGIGGAGGGGAGLGGAVLVDGSTSSFTANGCTFVNNQAQGGTGGSTNAGSLQAGGGGGGMGAAGSAPVGTTGGDGGGVNGGNGGPQLNVGGNGGVGGGAGGGGAGANGTSIGRPGGTGGFGGGAGGGGNFSHGGFGGFGGGGGGGGGGRGTSLGGSGGFGAGAGGLGLFNGKGGGGGGGAGLGGAIFSNGGTLTLVNDTFTQNSAIGGAGGTGATAGGTGSGRGGAIFVRNGTLNATFVTLSGNIAAQGATDLFVLSDGGGQQATATLRNSILGQNAFTSVADFFAATNGGGLAANLSASSNNLVTLNASGSNGLPAGSLVAGTNPNFDPAGLADNGGPTRTIALTTASIAALRAGAGGTGVLVDQRGLPRGADPDLGAYSLATLITSITSSDVSLIASDPNPAITFVLSTPADAGTFTGSDVSVKDSMGNTVGTMGALVTTDNLHFTGALTLSAGFNGVALISVAADQFTAVSGIGNQVSPTLLIAVDKVAPAVTAFSSTDLSLIAGDANPAVTFTLNEAAAVGTFTASDVSVKDSTGNIVGTMGTLSTTDNQTFTGIFTPNAGFTGTALISVAANRFTDVPGNGNSASTALGIVVDKVAPAVTSITSTDLFVNASDPDPTITFTLSEPAAAGSFTAGDVRVRDGAGAVVGTMGALGTSDNRTFTGIFTPNAGYTGAALISVEANQFTDMPGNSNSAASSTLSIAVDTVAPTVTAITTTDASLIIGDADPTITFTLSEAVAPGSFTGDDVSIKDGGGATVGSLGALSTSDDITFTGTLTPNAAYTGTAFVSVEANRFTDVPGNGNMASSVLAIAVDEVAPAIDSITSSDPALAMGDADPTITFTLSEAAAAGSFTAADVSVLDGSGAVVGTMGALSTSDSITFTGTFTPSVAYTGAALISIGANQFTDVPGNGNAASSNLNINVDKVAPTVSSIAASDIALANGDADPAITFTLSEAAAAGSFTAADVSVLDSTGAVAGIMGALSTSDNQTFIGTFTPNAGFNGTALITIAAGQFTDVIGNPSSTASPTLGIEVDTVSPTVTAITSTGLSVTNADADPTITFTLSEAAAAGTFTAVDVSVLDGTGAVVGTMGALGTSDNQTFTGTFTPNAGFVGTALIGVAANEFTDPVGNGNTASSMLGIAVDRSSPVISAITSTDVALKIGDTNPKISFTLNEVAKAGTFTASDISIKDSIGTVVGTMGTLTTTNNKTFTGSFTPKAGFNGTALISVAANQFTNAAGRGNLASPQLAIEIDKVAPKLLAITSSDLSLVVGDADPTITFTLSEAAAAGTFTASDVSVKNSAGFTVGTMGALTTSDNTTFSGSFTPNAAFTGTARISVAANRFTDAVGNNNSASTALSIAVDRTAPTVKVTANDYALKAGQFSTLTIVLSERPGAGTQFTLSDLIVVPPGSGTLSNFSQATERYFFGLFERVVELTYTVRFTPAPGYEGNATITVAQGAFSDAAGNLSVLNDNTVIAVDLTPPTTPSLSLAAASDSGLVGDNITNVKLPTITGVAEAGAKVTLRDGTTVIGATTALADGSYSIVPTSARADGVHRLSVMQTDLSGNISPWSVPLPLTVDTKPPAVTITSNDLLLTSGQTATLSFKLSEAPAANTFDASDISVTRASLSGFAQSASSDLLYTALFTPDAGLNNIAASISIATGSFTDAAGNANSSASLSSVKINNTVAQLVQAMASFDPPAGATTTPAPEYLVHTAQLVMPH
ncbi:Ig-like domain-containing protein [Caenimonas sp. SL110]|uniref:Ig-like domain-containing protein n=1 Tax=Caenimonas sp. SL110 TaxID=1450524 RepID=UPI0006547AC5|nr:Ig-like domain-containing protein [Caenimonas sp. SL110]